MRSIANPIGQVVAAIASLIVLLIAYTIFGPMIDGVLSGLVYDAIQTGTGTALDINSSSLIVTVKFLIMGMKLFSWFIIFAVMARLFIYLGFFTEEQGVY